MNGQIQYAATGSLTSEATPAADPDIASRLARLREELRLAGPSPSRSDLERLLTAARELSLRNANLAQEVEEIRATLEAVDLAAQIADRGLPIVDTLEPLPSDERCHFVTPVRFGRRRNDQWGHLELTNRRVRFHGVLDLSVVWTEVGSVERTGRIIVVALIEGGRVLRFCCHAISEAARAEVVARQLVAGAADGSADYHKAIG